MIDYKSFFGSKETEDRPQVISVGELISQRLQEHEEYRMETYKRVEEIVARVK